MTAREPRRVISLLAGFFLFNAGTILAQTAQPGASADSQKIEITADKLSAADGGTKIEASGNVEIKRDQTTIKADELRMDRSTEDIEAQGKVSMSAPEWKLRSAESFQFNLGRETGEARNADFFIEQGHLSISGRRFQKFAGQSYRVDDGFVTTCLCASGAPDWKFSAGQMDLSADGVGIIRNGYLYVLDVPVFYLPYGFFPLGSERQTGFLFPQYGSSTEEGFRFQQPFFWAISKSTDATLTLDLQMRARYGVIGELRTIFDRDSDLQLSPSYFNESFRKNEENAVEDRTITDQRIPENRWNVAATHRYLSNAGWLTYSDIAAYSDDLFTRELAERFDIPGERVSDIRASRYGQSRFGVFRNWGDTFVQGEGRFYQDFIQPDRTTLHRTPQAVYWGRRFLTAFPLEFRWRADAVNYVRRVGGDGLRLDLRPEVVLPLRMGPYLFGSLNLAPRETAYHLYTPVKSGERNLSRELIEVRGQIGTTLNRIFAWRGAGLNGLKHFIEPELNYLFIPNVSQSDIPIMDAVDRINRRNVLTVALSNRLWGKFGAPSAPSPAEDKESELLNPIVSGNLREVGNLKLAMSYEVDRARADRDRVSDLDINLRLQPAEYITMSFDGGVNPGPWRLTQARARFGISDPRPVRQTLDPDFNQPNSLSITYSYVRRGPNDFLAEDANINLDAPADCMEHPSDPRCPTADSKKNLIGQVGGTLLYHVTDYLLVFLSGGYNIRDHIFPGYRSSIKILSGCECWSLTFTFQHSLNPSKTTFNFDFSLLGLGASRSALR